MPVCPRCAGTVPSTLGLCAGCMFGELLPARIGSIRLAEEIGRGGMSTVYRGIDETLERDVAVKLLTAPDGDFAQRIEREGRLLASLSHPNIVRVHATGVVECHHYVAMELVEGAPLSQQLVVTRDRAIEIARQVCAALAHAHARGIVHRDIKPSNVLVERSGRVKVSDFGIAREITGDEPTLTGSQMVVCTPGYAAPEVWAGAAADPRMDIYAVGVLLLDMLGGRDDATEIDAPLDLIIRRATAVRPSERFASAQQMMWALEDLRRRTRTERAIGVVAPLVACLAVFLGGAASLGNIEDGPAPNVHVFRQGHAGYDSVREHWFSPRDHETHNLATAYLRAASSADLEIQSVLRFDALFGDEVSQIPTASAIKRATLTLTLPANLVYSDGEAFAVHELLVDWDPEDGYGDAPWRGGATAGIDVDGIEAAIDAVDDSVRCTDLGTLEGGLIPQGARIDLDVTSIVARWSAGSDNYGFLLRSLGGRGGDSTFIAGSRWPDHDLRPTLTVTLEGAGE